MQLRSTLPSGNAAAAPAGPRQARPAPLVQAPYAPYARQSSFCGNNVRPSASRQARSATRLAVAAAAAGPKAAQQQQESQLQPFLRWAIANGAFVADLACGHGVFVSWNVGCMADDRTRCACLHFDPRAALAPPASGCLRLQG